MDKRTAVITGFHKSTDFLKTLFHYLNLQNFKNFDVYIYNSSSMPIEEKYNNVNFNYYFVNLSNNMGFAGGNNAAILYAKQKFDYDYYVLVNDDTKPDKNWLKALIETAENNPKAGAVASKMVYYEKFIALKVKTQTSTNLDARPLGVKFYNNSNFKNCFYSKRFFREGFYNHEEDNINEFRWTKNEFEIAIPVTLNNAATNDYTLNLYIQKNPTIKKQTLIIEFSSSFFIELELSDDKIHYQLLIPQKIIEENAHYIIQNAGSTYDEVYNGKDIGSGEIDLGQYDTLKKVDMFCGGSCLLTKQALEKTGLFNPYYFCYYEDTDLSLRMKKKGYEIIYNPASLLLHHHSASSKEWSPFFTYHVFRNKIIFASKNFGYKASVVTFKERYRETMMFYRWSAQNKFKNRELNHRLKLNLTILKDALKGLIKYKPTKF